MGRRVSILLWFSLFPAFSQTSLAQIRDSAFDRQHPLNRPDSVLVKDTLLFPIDTVFSKSAYTMTEEQLHWSDSGSITYKAQCKARSAYITLRADHSFVFQSDRETWGPWSIGRWWLVHDSLICLNWFDTLSMQMAKRPRFDLRHQTYSDPVFAYMPTRIDHWWFVRRGSTLVPY